MLDCTSSQRRMHVTSCVYNKDRERDVLTELLDPALTAAIAV